jgi:hypothetical protein
MVVSLNSRRESNEEEADGFVLRMSLGERESESERERERASPGIGARCLQGVFCCVHLSLSFYLALFLSVARSLSPCLSPLLPVSLSRARSLSLSLALSPTLVLSLGAAGGWIGRGQSVSGLVLKGYGSG